MGNRCLSPETTAVIEKDIKRLETRAAINKRTSDAAGAIVIVLGALSGVLIATPDETLRTHGVLILRQLMPVLTAAAYAGMRYYRWGEKHRWYWYQRHRLCGLLVRSSEGDSSFSREYADILLSAEVNYPHPVYLPQDNEQVPGSSKTTANQSHPPLSGDSKAVTTPVDT